MLCVQLPFGHRADRSLLVAVTARACTVTVGIATLLLPLQFTHHSTYHVPRQRTHIYGHIDDNFVANVIKCQLSLSPLHVHANSLREPRLAPGRSGTTYTGDDKLGVLRRRLAPALPAPPYKPTLIPRASPSRQKLTGLLTGETAWTRTAAQRNNDDTTRRRLVSARVREHCPRGYSNPRHSSLHVQLPPSRR